MKLLYSCLISWALVASIASATGSSVNCQVHPVSSFLGSLSTGKQFCTPVLYPLGIPTKIKTTTLTVTSSKCSTDTRTRLTHEVVTETVFSISELPLITVTQYASTVLIPSGTYPAINKRNPAPAITPVVNKPKYPTPTPLSTCCSETISKACSLLLDNPSVVRTHTSTHTADCTLKETITSTTFRNHVVTTTVFAIGTPPPFFVSASGVLTTTVPAVCAGGYYVSPGDIPPGTGVFYPQYPDYPETDVECCVFCFEQQNCLVNFYNFETAICEILQFLNYTGAALPGVSAQCPFGVFDYQFGALSEDGNILPGPCGR